MQRLIKVATLKPYSMLITGTTLAMLVFNLLSAIQSTSFLKVAIGSQILLKSTVILWNRLLRIWFLQINKYLSKLKFFYIFGYSLSQFVILK